MYVSSTWYSHNNTNWLSAAFFAARTALISCSSHQDSSTHILVLLVQDLLQFLWHATHTACSPALATLLALLIAGRLLLCLPEPALNVLALLLKSSHLLFVQVNEVLELPHVRLQARLAQLCKHATFSTFSTCNA